LNGRGICEMANHKVLLDTNIIIDVSKGILSQEEIFKDYEKFYTSVITCVEALGYQFTDEEEKELILEIIRQVEVVDINQAITQIAIAYKQRRKIQLADALILATAKHIDADLLTSDIADFKNVDTSVRLVQPKRKR
jgi:predicted nucleic acid-binding protein